jgi:hypothetical protein
MLVFQKGLVEHSVSTVQSGMNAFMGGEVRELLSGCEYGKKDTMRLDALPEIIFNDAVAAYHRRAVFVTEETDKQTIARMPESYHPEMQPVVFIADPVDRSKFIKKFIIHLFKKKAGNENYNDSNLTIGDLWKEFDVKKEWEDFFKEFPAVITGATSALTCVAEGRVVCSVIGNLITKEIILSCEQGVYLLDLSTKGNIRFLLDDISVCSKKIDFPGPLVNGATVNGNEVFKKFVTFTGKEGYREHFDSSKIILGKDGMDKHLYHKEPGGPSRVAYLSSLNAGQPTVGFVLYNGEKITEWSHGLAMVKYAKDNEGQRLLRIYEVYTKPLMEKNGIPMSATPDLSIFRERPVIGKFMDINKISQFRNPSHLRAMIIICHRDNLWLTTVMKQKDFREIGEFI